MSRKIKRRGRKARRNPLASYLSRHDLTATEFALRLTKQVGAEVSRIQVWRWASGRTKPGILWRAALARATRKEVRADAW